VVLSEVLGSCCEEELVAGTIWSTQSQSVQLENALRGCADSESLPNDLWHEVLGAITFRIISMRLLDARPRPTLN